MVIWALVQPVPVSRHRFKYRLYFGKNGKRIAGCDNERGKGDHRHLRSDEQAYQFVSPERLIEDFLADVAEARRGR